jgi:sialidase-1
MRMNRRQWLKTTGGFMLTGMPKGAASSPRATVLETRTISLEPAFYNGWPTVARRRSGELLLAYSGGREAHVCPFGRVEFMTSRDGGRTWTWPRVLIDSAIDDRDAGVLETAAGTLLLTTFSSLAYEKSLEAAAGMKPGEEGAWPAERLARWRAVHDRLPPAERGAELGEWLIRSVDGGRSWSERIPTIVNSPHGPIQLSDGRLLYPGKQLWTGEGRIGVAESIDDGRTWHWLAPIPPRAGDTVGNYHELHGVEASPGRIVVQIRNHNKQNAGETLQSESSDGGKSWTEPHSIGAWGLPSFLTKLRSGNLLMTYGYRRSPFGNQARLSPDQGRSWSEPMTVSSDGASGDLGYPSTVELEDGSLVTVWYERLKDSPNAVLRQAHWKIE